MSIKTIHRPSTDFQRRNLDRNLLPSFPLAEDLCCVKRKDKNAKGAQRVRAKEEDVGETALASLYLSARDQSPRNHRLSVNRQRQLNHELPTPVSSLPASNCYWVRDRGPPYRGCGGRSPQRVSGILVQDVVSEKCWAVSRAY